MSKFSKFAWMATGAAAMSLAALLAFAIVVFPGDPAAPTSAQDDGPPGETALPELVARHLESGNLDCPRESALRYEACLLYKGALGTWRYVDFADKCPPGIRPDASESSRSQEQAEARAIKPDDARHAPQSGCFRSIYAALVANTTPILSGTALRAFYLNAKQPFPEPGDNAELCVEVRHGICGNQAAIGLALLEMAEIEARRVKFFYEARGTRNSHIIVEALIDDDWRLIDTTYGAYWSASGEPGSPFALATSEQVFRDPEIRTRPIFNVALMPYRFYAQMAPLKPFEYLENEPDIIRGETGTISLDLPGRKGVENFANIPNYVGDNVPNRTFSGIVFDLSAEEKVEPIDLTIQISSAAISGEKPVWFCLDTDCRRIDQTSTELSFQSVNPDKIYLKTENDVAYAVLKSLRWQVAEMR